MYDDDNTQDEGWLCVCVEENIFARLFRIVIL